MPCFQVALVGAESLLIRCGEILRSRHHEIRLVLTDDPAVVRWARAGGVAVLAAEDAQAPEALRRLGVDYLFSIVHLRRVPAEVLAVPRRAAINFHDGPLPRYAGVHAPVWALFNGEPVHGVTWHVMTNDLDGGDILVQAPVSIAADDTALSLNLKCYQAGAETFAGLLEQLESGRLAPRAQEGIRSYYGRDQRPGSVGPISWAWSGEDIVRRVRALDYGSYPNPMGLMAIGPAAQPLLVVEAGLLARSTRLPGTVQAITDDALVVATPTVDVALRQLRTCDGRALRPREAAEVLGLREGHCMPEPTAEVRLRLATLRRQLARSEDFWVRRLTGPTPSTLPHARTAPSTRGDDVGMRAWRVPDAFASAAGHRADRGPLADQVAALFAAYVARVSGEPQVSLGYADRRTRLVRLDVPGWLAPLVPLRVAVDSTATVAAVTALAREELARVRKHLTYLADLPARYPAVMAPDRWPTAVVIDDLQTSSAYGARTAGLVCVIDPTGRDGQWVHDRGVIGDADMAAIAGQFEAFLAGAAGPEVDDPRPIARLPLMAIARLR